VDLTSTDHIQLTVPASPAAVRIARAGAAGLATRAGFTYPEIEQVRLAVGEATALLAPGPGEDGTLALRFDVSPDGLRVDLRLVGGSGDRPGATRDVPSIAAAVLDSAVDDWEIRDGGRRLVLGKVLAAADGDDDDD
jgi:serine/threonine-protein kinase RsbW